jgi:hypothetical protein
VFAGCTNEHADNLLKLLQGELAAGIADAWHWLGRELCKKGVL